MTERKIGSYTVVRQIGVGGMSEVYEVENDRLGSRHALKLFAYAKDDSVVRERFRAEGRVLARLSHPRIVKVTDLGTAEDNRPYFVMGLVLDERGTVRSLADVEPGTADEETVGRWYDDMREGLAYIHANGVVHRDLKLQNVLIGPDGHAVLTDFGISSISPAKDGERKSADMVKTLVRMREGRSLVMGSIGYMSPEVEMGIAASPQSDYYALGVIVYRLLTGTWCDARTDVVGSLETYDPVWRRILPKLLHANPDGRECLSYADEKRRDREHAELEWEERWLREKARGHLARHVARYGWALIGVFGVVLALIFWKGAERQRALQRALTDARRQLALPSFSDVCQLPAEGRDDGSRRRSKSQAALIDAWVVTRGIFDDLKTGRITREKATESLMQLAERAESDYIGLFPVVGGYAPSGGSTALAQILKNAVKRMGE